MPEATEPDPTDRGTQRPNVTPLQEKGTEFILFECPDFEFEITLPANASPEDPITLFTLYYTPEIVQSIVQCTNNLPWEAQDPSRPKTRANQWYPTCEKELYIFIVQGGLRYLVVESATLRYVRKGRVLIYIIEKMQFDPLSPKHKSFLIGWNDRLTEKSGIQADVRLRRSVRDTAVGCLYGCRLLVQLNIYLYIAFLVERENKQESIIKPNKVN
jgi:hypothetical protein